MEPLYKLPTDTSSASASAYVTGRIRDTGAAYAVSKVTPAASLETAPERFKSEANWRAYLAGLDLRTNSYSIGNQLQSSVSQIKAYGTLLGVDLVKITVDWLNENQNPETGLWHYEVSYTASNSLHKIFSVYNSFGYPIPNIDKAASAAFASITSDEPLSAGVDIMNAWSVIPYIFQNVRKYNPDANDVIAKVLAELYKNAPEMIDVTREKIAPFKKEDGSFSYNPNYSSSTSQGVPSAIPGSVEGDVNGNLCASVALLEKIFYALEFTEIVPMYTKSDLDTYIGILESCIPIEKGGEEESVAFDFDGEDIGSSPVDLTIIDSTLGGSGVIADPRPGAKGNVYKHVHKPDFADTITVPNYTDSLTKSKHVFEGDFCIASATDGYNMQITLGSAFLFTYHVKNGNVSIVVSSSTTWSTTLDVDLGVSIPVGEWFNIKVEYFFGDHDTVRTVIYLNGKAIAVTDNYYGKPKTGVGNPAALYNGTIIHFMKPSDMTIMVDNLHSYSENGLYSPIKLEDDSYVNVDKDKAEAQTPV